MLTVAIETPFKPTGRRGNGEAELAYEKRENAAYALAALRDSLMRGEAPFASHMLYTQVLNDAVTEERSRGMRAGLALTRRLDAIAVYTDLGISIGMRDSIEAAERDHRSIFYRRVQGWPLKTRLGS